MNYYFIGELAGEAISGLFGSIGDKPSVYTNLPWYNFHVGLAPEDPGYIEYGLNKPKEFDLSDFLPGLPSIFQLKWFGCKGKGIYSKICLNNIYQIV